MLKALLSRVSPSGGNARLSVVILHRVLRAPDPLFPGEVHARRFDQMCKWLKHWLNILPLDEAVARLKDGTLPSRAGCITFDDGYEDNCDVALPILQHHGLKATFFIATGYLNGGHMWNDAVVQTFRSCRLMELDLSAFGLGNYSLHTDVERRAAIHRVIDSLKYLPVEARTARAHQIAEFAKVALPQDLMMTSDQVLRLHRAGMQIGAHTVSHPILARIADDQARLEIAQSRQYLENLLGERVGLFAYPNGRPGDDYNRQTIDIVRSLGFDAAVSTQWGSSGGKDDMFQIRRFTPWDQSQLRFGFRLFGNLRKGNLVKYPLV